MNRAGLLAILICTLVFCRELHSQKDESFSSLWAKVELLNKDGKTTSALEVVEEIYAKAAAENKGDQKVKAIIYRMILTGLRDENAFENSIKNVEDEISRSSEPVTSILHSALAEMYWWYYQFNRWQILQRSTTANKPDSDLSVWDAADFIDRICLHFDASLSQAELIKKVDANAFDLILEKGNDKGEMIASLYGVLAFRVLEFYSNSESGLTKPQDQFSIRGAECLGDVTEFINLNFIEVDTFSFERRAIRLYQQLLKHQIETKNENGLVYFDLKRLNYVRDRDHSEARDSLYIRAINRKLRDHGSAEAAAEVMYEKAFFYFNLGNKYNAPGGIENRWLKVKSMRIAERCIEKFEGSTGASMCFNLVEQIRQKEIQVELENVVTVGRPFLLSVRYRNASRIFCRIIRNQEEVIRANSQHRFDYDIQHYLEKPAFRTLHFSLIDSMDFQSHRTELVADALPPGYYSLIFSLDSNFNTRENIFLSKNIWSSNLAYFVLNERDGPVKIYVTDRKSGIPMKNIRADLFIEEYNYQQRYRQLLDGGSKYSDENGLLLLSGADQNHNYHVLLSSNGDSLVLSTQVYVKKTGKEEVRTVYQSFLFTDRAIYRPGQIVYFKGIILERNGNEVNPVKGKKLSVSLMDVNRSEIGKADLETNEFGTYKGSFTLPSAVLTGRFEIFDGSSRNEIVVEEYKRPTFRIETEAIRENISLGDTVNLHGKAISWNGVALTGASGNFRVVRQVSFPFYYERSGWILPPRRQNGAEIIHGTFRTDERGEFIISFEARPDQSVNKELNPVFNYEIQMDVTDVNGEIQQKTTAVKVGYQSLLIKVELKEMLNREDADSLKLITTNLHGEFTASTVGVELYKLIDPGMVLRRRLWESPDYRKMKREEFKRIFPEDEYDGEATIDQWPLGQKVYSTTVNSGKIKFIDLTAVSAWKEGPFALRLSGNDSRGNPVRWEGRTVLFSEKTADLPIPSAMWISPLSDAAVAGEEIDILAGSSRKGSRLFYSLRNKEGLVREGWMEMSGKKQRIGIPITPEYRGNASIQFRVISGGRLYSYDQSIQVPYENKILKAEMLKVDEEVVPGDSIHWKIRITARDSTFRNAEMLASMYDMSLDALRPHQWNFNPFPTAYTMVSISTGDNFRSGSCNIYPFYQHHRAEWRTRTFDRLNWFGFSYFSPVQRMYATAMDMTAAPTVGEKNGSAGISELKESQTTGNSERETLESPISELPVLNRTDLRRNFNETAFFYPKLRSDSNGIFEISCKIPDALTRWKLQAVVHSEELESVVVRHELIAKKDLMVIPNYPRFLTAGDTVVFTVKISNAGTMEQVGNAELAISGVSGNPDPGLIIEDGGTKKFRVPAGASSALNWRIVCGENEGLVRFSISARSEHYQDREERTLPVLSDRVLVTESYPISLRPGQKREVNVENVVVDNEGSAIRPYKYSLEFTDNPSWYALLALPYLSENENESSDQLFTRYYANSIGLHICRSSGQIASIFKSWKALSSEHLKSNLETNQDLKDLLLSESPWLLDAKSESENRQKLGLFFDENNLQNSLDGALVRLLQNQSPNGGWPWFKGMNDDPYISQHILAGLGKLRHLGITEVRNNSTLRTAVLLALDYLDERMDEYYHRILRNKDWKETDHLSQIQIHYLYARSFFPDVPVSPRHQEAMSYFRTQAGKYWLSRNRYLQGMIALAAFRNKNPDLAKKIIVSLKENAIHKDEFGMYWKGENGYYWYESDIESQALLIEAFDEIAGDSASVEEMKIYLLKQKQSRMWKSSKATSDACYALLLRGRDLLTNGGRVRILFSGREVPVAETQREAGSGYFRKTWSAAEISADMSVAKAENKGDGLSWGAVYYQYFQNAEETEKFSAGLSVDREIYLRTYKENGPVYHRVSEIRKLKKGDVVMVRLIVKADRNLEYVHLKDMRASGLEISDNRSGYRYNAGIGYYLSVRDAAHHYFFDRMDKGTYVIEYGLKAERNGNFSCGHATAQCFYAPEFSAHSEGSRLEIH